MESYKDKEAFYDKLLENKGHSFSMFMRMIFPFVILALIVYVVYVVFSGKTDKKLKNISFDER